jgi:alpha-D-ribose 1-methylphosphonate 5-triphosphate synthase subunit PhnI
LDEIQEKQIMNQMALAVDRVMAEGALYAPLAAATAIRQAQGDLVEAVFLVRAFRTTLPRFGNSKPAATDKMRLFRRISGIFKDIPGGQILGPTYDYTHRLIEFERQEPQIELPPIPEPNHPETGPIDEKFIPWVRNLLVKQNLIAEIQDELIGASVPDLTRQPLKLPAGREVRLQSMARGDEGFLLASAYSLQRGFGLDRHPFLGELRVGWVTLAYTPPELGFEIEIGEVKVTECFMVNRTNGDQDKKAGLEDGYSIIFGQNERKAMSAALLDRSLTKAAEADARIKYPAQDQEFILAHSDNVESSGFVQHLKRPHYVDFQSELVFIRNQNKGKNATVKPKDAHRV